MNDIPRNITLNGQYYDEISLLTLCKSNKNNISLSNWEQKLYTFIHEWISDKETITVHTSGSTGKPKIIEQTKKHMVNSALMTQEYFSLSNKTNALLCLPVSYIAGKMMVVRAFVTGMNLITVEPTSTPFETIAIPIHFAAITPFQLARSISIISDKQINTILIGGGSISTSLEIQCQSLQTKLFASYGMTETCSHIAIRAINGINQSAYFESLKGIEINIDDRKCLVIHAPMVSSEIIITNDIVELIDNTHFEWIGRYDNVINTGGIKIFPEQVEKKLSAYISHRFFIAALPDNELEQIVSLFIEIDSFTNEEEKHLKQLLHSKLKKYEIPRRIILLKQFALSDSGKILKKKTIDDFLIDKTDDNIKTIAEL